jgi:TonB family protein
MLASIVLAALVMVQEPAAVPNPMEPARVGSEIKPPKKIKSVAPDYPEDARRAGLTGLVIVESTIDKNGSVSSARVLRGVPPLTGAAIKAVKKWRFTPTVMYGVAVPVIMTVTVQFALDSRDLRFELSDLLTSLENKNEFIRESAVNWLAKGRDKLNPDDYATVQRELQRVSKHETSEIVKVAIAQALVQFDAK